LKETQSQSPGAAAARKSGRLGAAEARLDAALDRLDAALGACMQSLAERAEDEALLTRLQEENAALQQTREAVSARLDAAVERLRRVLAH
jgi:ElaB/YqjD/DUF883 family membrane-anchored ribosome-binding protein